MVLDFSLCESDLEDLDFLIEQSQLIISTNKLGTQYISLDNGFLMLLSCSLVLDNSLTDDDVELLDLGGFLLQELISNLPQVLFNLECLLCLLLFLHVNTKFVMFGCKGLILSFNLIFELGNLVLSDLELLSQFNNFIVSFNKIFTIQISIRTDYLIQVLLLFQLALEFNIFLLEFTDQVLL